MYFSEQRKQKVNHLFFCMPSYLSNWLISYFVFVCEYKIIKNIVQDSIQETRFEMVTCVASHFGNRYILFYFCLNKFTCLFIYFISGVKQMLENTKPWAKYILDFSPQLTFFTNTDKSTKTTKIFCH